MAEQNQPEVVEAPQPSVNQRNDIEAEIAKQFEARRQAEEAAVAQPETTVPSGEAPEPEPETPRGPEMVKVKVEGNEYEVPKEQVDAEGGLEFYQKRAAANLIFQRAKQREDEANRILAEARQPKQPPQSTEPQNPVAQLIETIRFETDPTKAAEAVKQLVAQTTLTQQQVMGLVHQQLEADRSIGKFKSDFPEIAKDPLLYKMAVDLENHARQSGNTEPNESLHQKIGKFLSDKYIKPSGDMQEKKDKKATVINIPQAKAKAQAPEPPKEKTVQEIIADERRSRKQIV
jgi:hypothetical protein